MERTYKLTRRGQLLIVKEHFPYIILTCIIYFIFIHYYPGKDDLEALTAIACYLVLGAVPSFIFHYQYYLYSEGKKIIVNADEHRMTIEGERGMDTFLFGQIKSIKLVLTVPLYRGFRRGSFPWQVYHYAVLEIDGDVRFVITCLLIRDLRIFFKDLGLEVVKERRALPWISMKKYKKKIEKSADGW